MTDPFFFRSRGALSLAEIVTLTGAQPAGDADLLRGIEGVKPLDLAGPKDIAYCNRRNYVDDLRATAAGACFVTEKLAAEVPPGTLALVTPHPQTAYVTVARTLYEEALKPAPVFGTRGVDSGAFVHPHARLEEGVTVDPGAVIGPGAEIGTGTVISACAVIGADVRIGRDCVIGPNASVLHALIGDRVIIHAGVRLGQDGFGYLPGKSGHLKIPQIGRVIVQDDVEIGAGTAIDRGAGRDTMIGEGSKIDNLVQIGHNVSIGRHCIIVALTGISGSVTIGDGVVIGGQVGVADHVTIGDGARIASQSGVMRDAPEGVELAGSPAKPIREFFRELTTLERLAAESARRKPAQARNRDDGDG